MSARILIVEDEWVVAMELEMLLTDQGHSVVGIAADADAAREIALTNQLDLALVDIHLADGPTGMEVGRELANEHGATVVYVTANPGLMREGIAGTIGVLPKPTDEESILSVVEYALRRRLGDQNVSPPEALRAFG
ncbi:response regulator [Brevundimonas sp. 2R-24]|uniref:Response regulator n=1 Tax=Peiella sedimenti TaxID=3061083 RepID=A0ABT8SQX2_9CAUL|nr:response regulator [Caulobacteraceae bacterium XZ-24]